MSENKESAGIVNNGGTIVITGTAVGDNATVIVTK